jgi:hypothetical protein
MQKMIVDILERIVFSRWSYVFVTKDGRYFPQQRSAHNLSTPSYSRQFKHFASLISTAKPTKVIEKKEMGMRTFLCRSSIYTRTEVMKR